VAFILFKQKFRSKLALSQKFPEKRKASFTKTWCLTIQILHYEFLGPIKLSEWGPPMEEVVYIILERDKDRFNILYVDQSDKTEEKDFFIKNEKFKCWISHASSENNLYLSILPMWKSDKKERERIVYKTISKYNPICNQKNE